MWWLILRFKAFKCFSCKVEKISSSCAFYGRSQRREILNVGRSVITSSIMIEEQIGLGGNVKSSFLVPSVFFFVVILVIVDFTFSQLGWTLSFRSFSDILHFPVSCAFYGK